MPAIVTKDLSIVIYGRSGPRSLKQFFTSQYYKNPDANRLTGLYELVLKRASDIGKAFYVFCVNQFGAGKRDF
jgi:kinesin family protein 1